jgi:hypothetical protein
MSSTSVTLGCSVEDALQGVMTSLQMKLAYGTLPSMLEAADVLSLIEDVCIDAHLSTIDGLPSRTLRSLGNDAKKRMAAHKPGEVDGFVSSSLLKSLERAKMELALIAA